MGNSESNQEPSRVVDIQVISVDLDLLRSQIQYLEVKLGEASTSGTGTDEIESILNLLEAMLDIGESVIR